MNKKSILDMAMGAFRERADYRRACADVVLENEKRR